MRVRFARSNTNSLLFFLMFLIAMQLAVSRTLLMIALLVVFAMIAHRMKEPAHRADMVQIQKLCLMTVGLLGFFILIQIFVLGLGVREVALDVATLSCAHIGCLAGAIGMRAFQSFETWLKGILMFEIGFSVYYILLILVSGMPVGRGSALGNVSSNFCSAVLYLNYPVIFYYLFACRGRRRKWLVGMCYVALALSLAVIASSGSRTAMGCVALMVVQLLFFRQKRARNFMRYVMLIGLGVVGVGVIYIYVPGFKDVIERALDAFGGNEALNTDVRQLIWAAALAQFRSGNIWIGSGSGYVTQFDRSVHNLFYEILLCTGWIGLALFIMSSALLIFLMLRTQRRNQRFFTVMLLIAALLVAFLQPFFSTSYPCGMIVWMSMFVLAYDAKENV